MEKWKKQPDWLGNTQADKIREAVNRAVAEVLQGFGLPYEYKHISLEFMRTPDQLTPSTLCITTTSQVEQWIEEIRDRLNEISKFLSDKTGEIYGFLCSIEKALAVKLPKFPPYYTPEQLQKQREIIGKTTFEREYTGGPP